MHESFFPLQLFIKNEKRRVIGFLWSLFFKGKANILWSCAVWTFGRRETIGFFFVVVYSIQLHPLTLKKSFVIIVTLRPLTERTFCNLLVFGKGFYPRPKIVDPLLLIHNFLSREQTNKKRTVFLNICLHSSLVLITISANISKYITITKENVPFDVNSTFIRHSDLITKTQ